MTGILQGIMMFSEELSGSHIRMVESYWKMKDFSIFTVPYAYVDHFSYLADNLICAEKDYDEIQR